jgi:hypothetical protein
MADQAMIDQEMEERLRLQVFLTVLEGFFMRDLEKRLRRGERVSFYLPHSDDPSDRVEIGGAFFSAVENPVQNVRDILVDLMKTTRPFCQGWIFELDIQDLEHVEWRVRDWLHEDKIRGGGPEPLDQALIRMSRPGHEEGQLENMLSLVGTSEEQLPDWEVTFLRSCCLSLRKEREDRLFYAINLSLAPEDAVVASTSIRTSIGNGDKVIVDGKRVATYREHIQSFVLEVAKRIDSLTPHLTEAVSTEWGQMPVVITPPDLWPDKFLSERHRLMEI